MLRKAGCLAFARSGETRIELAAISERSMMIANSCQGSQRFGDRDYGFCVVPVGDFDGVVSTAAFVSSRISTRRGSV